AARRLQHFEPFELRMVEIKRLVLAGIAVCKTECFRPGPVFEPGPAVPERMRGIERPVFLLGAFEQMELDKSGDPVEMGVTAQPYLLEVLLEPFLDAEAVHRDEHLCSPCVDVRRDLYASARQENGGSFVPTARPQR